MSVEPKEKITSQSMLQKLDSHYETESKLVEEINIRVQKLNQIREDIKLMQTIILFQMKKEYSIKKK